MRDYEKDLKVPGDGATMDLFTLSGIHLAIAYVRCVFGGRGPYLEFVTNQIDKSKIFIPEDKLWKQYEPAVYYVEYRMDDNTKLYFQKKRVNYADYKPGMWYTSPFLLKMESGERLIEELKKPTKIQQLTLI